MSEGVDFCVIGGGIVGLAVALELLKRHEGASLVLLEKESGAAVHQTGHNSSVIHSGIYYAPGSLKARLCRAGAAETKRFAAEHGIPVQNRGKLIVATREQERGRLRGLESRAVENGIDVELLDAAELSRREPEITGIGAIFVNETAVVDYKQVCARMIELISALGGQLRFGSEVRAIRETANGVTIAAGDEEWTAAQLVTCAGLQADRIAKMSGPEPEFRIVPFRGEYFRLPDTWASRINHLIYPVPDPEVPFLGVHLTHTPDGGMTVGPNAVLGMAREGYPKFSFSARDVWNYATYPGMWKVARANLRSGVQEMTDSLFKRGYLARCREYCPSLALDDLEPYPAGIRAQAVLSDGTLVQDFLFAETGRILHVANAPSPAATSAIPIAREILKRLPDRKAGLWSQRSSQPGRTSERP